ncbi:TPA: hypothetical protein HA249_02635 [Candidatus Woesearchaeota archaeon]|nr:hypothetical protein [Candidatus Woesearchaeota archaeon]HII88608.1 hypothetical protein [Candidatus Woesearchaeota archaeon]
MITDHSKRRFLYAVGFGIPGLLIAGCSDERKDSPFPEHDAGFDATVFPDADATAPIDSGYDTGSDASLGDASDTLLVDRVAPFVRFLSPSAYPELYPDVEQGIFRYDDRVAFSAGCSDADSGIAAVVFSFGDYGEKAVFEPENRAVELPDFTGAVYHGDFGRQLRPGFYTLRIAARDREGNEGLDEVSLQVLDWSVDSMVTDVLQLPTQNVVGNLSFGDWTRRINNGSVREVFGDQANRVTAYQAHLFVEGAPQPRPDFVKPVLGVYLLESGQDPSRVNVAYEVQNEGMYHGVARDAPVFETLFVQADRDQVLNALSRGGPTR